jgi:methylaspartate ammonia-lyase
MLDAPRLTEAIDRLVAPGCRGLPVTSYAAFRDLLDAVRSCAELGVAASYGLSQALLHACALRSRSTMADVIRAEWGLEGPVRPVPILAQSGEERSRNVDKMILQGVDSLPHGLINTPSLVGPRGETLISYVEWVRNRVLQLRRRPSYDPILHFDVYGMLGTISADAPQAVSEVLIAMEQAARPFALRVEHPVDAGSRDEQIRALSSLRADLANRGSAVQLVADEWANTLDDMKAFNRARAAHVMQIKAPDVGPVHDIVDAVLDCKRAGVVAHLGGSCCETERSAQVCVHVALGSGADQILAKPGMDVDAGLSVVRNEMGRAIALSAAAAASDSTPEMRDWTG